MRHTSRITVFTSRVYLFTYTVDIIAVSPKLLKQRCTSLLPRQH